VYVTWCPMCWHPDTPCAGILVPQCVGILVTYGWSPGAICVDILVPYILTPPCHMRLYPGVLCAGPLCPIVGYQAPYLLTPRCPMGGTLMPFVWPAGSIWLAPRCIVCWYPVPYVFVPWCSMVGTQAPYGEHPSVSIRKLYSSYLTLKKKPNKLGCLSPASMDSLV
jgi:hypothetical protein